MSAPSTAEEKRKWIKNFIEKIPTKKKELFAWKVNWTLVDQVVNDRINIGIIHRRVIIIIRQLVTPFLAFLKICLFYFFA